METKEKDYLNELLKMKQILKKAEKNNTVLKKYSIQIEFITDTYIPEGDCSPNLFNQTTQGMDEKIKISIEKWVEENIETDPNLALASFCVIYSKFKNPTKVNRFLEKLKEALND